MLENIGPDLWIYKQPHRVPLFGDIGRSMSVIRLKDSSLMLISPIPLSSEELAQLQMLGSVKWIVSPNGVHHRYLPWAKEKFPQAQIWGPLVTADKHPEMKFDGILSDKTMAPWSAEVAMVSIQASIKSVGEEFLFFHARSRTVVMTDLMFHLGVSDSFWRDCIWWLNGILRTFSMSRLSRIVFSNRTELKKALACIQQWDPWVAIVAHGYPVLEDANKKIQESFTWVK